jgi:uncharacterized protein involved in exopolysaccharide biosynthesis
MQENQNEFNSFSLINYIWQRRKLFLIICGAAAVLSFVFSTRLFIRPQFKSTTIIYAPRTNSTSKILLSENNPNERLDIKSYAVEEETEQLMQILKSRDIKDMLIDKYDLVHYYAINTNAKGWKTKLYETLEGFVTIKRTQYGAILISVNDWNPVQAAEMANDIAAELDTIKNRIERDRAIAACQAIEKQLAEVEKHAKFLEDTIAKLVHNGVYIYERQVERVMQQHAIALAQGNMAGVQRLQKEIEKLEKWGPVSYIIRREQETLCNLLSFINQRLLSAKMDLVGPMPVKFVIESAVPADKKCYPKKIIIVLIATFGTFFMTLMVLLFMDKIKKEIVVKSQQNNRSVRE